MNIGVRGRLFLVSLFLILLVGFVTGLYLERGLRKSTEARIEQELARLARTVRESFETPLNRKIEAIDVVTDRLGEASSARITVIGSNGTVFGDSELTVAEVFEVENHGDRPEVIAALAQGRGVTRRHSDTIDTDMLYLALPLEQEGEVSGVVRVSMPLTDVDQAVRGLRLQLGVAGFLGLMVALVMSGTASHLFTRALRSLVRQAREIAGLTKTEPLPQKDEIARLADSFSHLTDELRKNITMLAEERDRSEAVIQGMTEALFELDADRCVTLVNKAGMDMLHTDDSPLGKCMVEILDIPGLEELIAEALAGHRVAVELTTQGPVKRSIFAQASHQSHSGGCILILLDITDVRKADQLQKDFIANASHELRTPISVILANTETLIDGAINTPKVRRKLLKALDRNARRLSRLIIDLLELARVDAGRHNLHLSRVDLNEVAQRAIEQIEAAAEEKQIRIINRLKMYSWVTADPEALERVLLNLLVNALKYIPPGEEVMLMDISTENGVRIEVQDSGPGIGAEHRERVFERFYRVDKSRSREMGGTGLGLSIVKDLVEAMGGEVGVEAVEPRGSRFWVTLPANRSTLD